jgi:DHA2 family multidrug resistance protein-like MFS transporter
LSESWRGGTSVRGLALGLLHEQKARAPRRLDPVGVVLSLAAILPFVYGLEELARHGWHW